MLDGSAVCSCGKDLHIKLLSIEERSEIISSRTTEQYKSVIYIFMSLVTYSSLHLSIHLSAHLFILHPSTNLSIIHHSFIPLSMHQYNPAMTCIHLSVYLLIHLCIHSSIHPSLSLFHQLCGLDERSFIMWRSTGYSISTKCYNS